MKSPETQQIQNPARIRTKHVVARRLLEFGIGRLSKSEILHKERIQEAENLISQGVGVIIVANHFSKKETFNLFKVPFSGGQMLRQRIKYPVAEHQKSPLIEFANKVSDAEAKYIITDETKKRYKKKGKQIVDEGRKLYDYANTVSTNIDEGGLSAIFIQGSRMPTLYRTYDEEGNEVETPPAISQLHKFIDRRAKKRGEKARYAIMFLGMIPEREDYTDLKDHYNWRTNYKLNVGHTFMIDELLERTNDDVDLLDNVIYAELEKYISPNYIGEGPLQEGSDFQRQH